MSRQWIKRFGALPALSAALIVAACSDQSTGAGKSESGDHGTEAEFERGPHNGRLLRSGTFAIELTIFETGVPPVFHVYPYDGGKPVAPNAVGLTIRLNRLGGKVDTFSFTPEGDFLSGIAPVAEPHSFDVVATASYQGKTHNWSFESYEGRTTIADKAAAQAGVTTERAGPATIKETVDLLGHLELAPGAKAELRARFPGKVTSVLKSVGDRVAAGDQLARIESNESLQTYAVVAPFAGVVLERNAAAGDVASDGVLFVIGDPTRMMADFHVFDRDVGKVRAGQAVRILPMHGDAIAQAKVDSVSPIKDPATQTVVTRVLLADASGKFLPGTTVKGEVVVNEVQVPLAVKTSAIQRFRDFEVAFAKVGQTYEVRMLEIGRRTPEWTEVLSGIAAGQAYVTGNSFLIKADIEKSGASHDH